MQQLRERELKEAEERRKDWKAMEEALKEKRMHPTRKKLIQDVSVSPAPQRLVKVVNEHVDAKGNKVYLSLIHI